MDLTGLPPTLADIDAFVADQSPDAYERVVDRLLASPAYGERMAVEWLDLARYADSHGYQDDGMRTMWPWRDWVIGAFNRNLPLDQFVTWQLAGDLLPSATDEQRLATGFNRNHMQSQEGGVVSEEYRVEYVADRVNTLGRALLGVSVECARCHDHKYDPISQKDYFRLFSFFNSVNESGQIPYSGVPSPAVMVVDAKTQAALDRVRAELATLEPGLRPEGADFDRRFATWLAKGSAAPPLRRAVPRGLIGHLPFDRAVRTMERPKAEPKAPPKPPEEVVAYENVATPRQRATAGGDKDKRPQTVPGRFGNAQRLPGDSYITIGKEFAYFDRHQPFSLSLWVRLDKEGTSGPLIARSGGVMNGNRGYEILLRADGTLSAGLHHVGPDNSIEIETAKKLVTGTWYHIGLTYDGSSRVAGLRLFLDGAPARTRALVDNLHRSIIYTTNKGTLGRCAAAAPGQAPGRDDRGRRLRRSPRVRPAVVGARHGAPRRRRRGGDPRPRHPAASRTAEQVAQLREHFLLDVDAEYARTLARATALRGRENDLLTALTEVMTMRDLPSPRPTFVLARGAYDAPTDRVEPGTPAAMGPFPKALPANRLGPGQMAARSGASAHLARDRESVLGAALRPRAGADAGRLRQPGAVAVAPGAARLAGDEPRAVGLGPEGVSEAAGDVGHVPAVLDRRRRASRGGSGQRVAVARAVASPRGRADPRRGAGGQWPAGARRSAAPACTRISRQACGRRWRRAMPPPTRRGTATTSIGAASTRCGSARRRRHRPPASTRPSACSAR